MTHSRALKSKGSPSLYQPGARGAAHLYGHRQFYADTRADKRKDEAAQRTARAYIEEGAFVEDHPSHLDHRPERPEGEVGERDEIGQRGRHAVSPAREVVAHLVRQEYRHDRKTVQGPSHPNGREDREHEQEDVQEAFA